LAEFSVAPVQNDECVPGQDREVAGVVVIQLGGHDGGDGSRHGDLFRFRTHGPLRRFEEEQVIAFLPADPCDDFRKPVPPVDVGGDEDGQPAVEGEGRLEPETGLAFVHEPQKRVVPVRCGEEVVPPVRVEVACRRKLGRDGETEDHERREKRLRGEGSEPASFLRFRCVWEKRVDVAPFDKEMSRASLGVRLYQVGHTVPVHICCRQCKGLPVGLPCPVLRPRAECGLTGEQQDEYRHYQQR